MIDRPILTLLYLLLMLSSCTKHPFSPWLLIEDTNGEFGYVDQNGDTIIAPGKYAYCYSDTFKTYGIVFHTKEGIVAIDRKEKILFNVFPYDNGPDYPSEGLFRIIVNGNIGFSDLTGTIVIQPKFACAYPFENGMAKVSIDCVTRLVGEHREWISENWIYIDRAGKIIK